MIPYVYRMNNIYIYIYYIVSIYHIYSVNSMCIYICIQYFLHNIYIYLYPEKSIDTLYKCLYTQPLTKKCRKYIFGFQATELVMEPRPPDVGYAATKIS